MEHLPSKVLPHAAGKIVNITKYAQDDDNEQNQKMSLDTAALEEIFGRKELVNCPVAIYCIAGMLRRGKSFFLNLVLRYLKFKVRNKTASWLDKKTSTINEGFEWRGGAVAHTKGILIWSEPFFLQTQKHGKVAVFLMDTQGIGDDSSSPDTDANLFSLSTLLSSYHIYNMKDVMNRRDLDMLKTYTEFGKKLQKTSQELHQTLLFLLRDWEDPEFDYGFRGGKAYFKKTFTEVSGTSEHYKNLCHNIKTSFKEVKCALLPHPGKKFVRMKNPTYEDIDEDFLEEIDTLLNDMFSEIYVKQNGEYPLTGNDIIDLATNFSYQMETNGIDADALFGIVAQNFLANVVGRCEEMFSKGAHDLHGSYRSNEELLMFHRNLVKEVLSYYDSERKVSSEENIRHCRHLLGETFNDRIFIFKNINEVNKQGVKDLYRALVKDCLAYFKDTLSIDLNPDKAPRDKTLIEYDDLKNTINDKERLAVKLYKNTVLKNPISSEICNQYQLKLEKEISLQEKLYKSLNYYLSFEMEKRLLEASIRATDFYVEGLKKEGRKETENIELWFAKLKLDAVEKYKSVNVYKQQALFKSNKINLNDNLIQLANNYRKRIDIERIGREAGQDVADEISTITTNFKKMVEKCSLHDTLESEREKHYQEFNEEILQSIPFNLQKQYGGTISLLFDSLQAENDFKIQILEDKFRLELLTIKEEIAKKLHVHHITDKRSSFLQKMTSTNVGNRCDQLKKEKDKLIMMFRNVVQDKVKWNDLAVETEESLKDFIDHATEIAKAQDEIQKDYDLEAAKKMDSIWIMRYTEHMDELLRKSKVNDEKLKIVQDKFLKKMCNNLKEGTYTDDVLVNYKTKMSNQSSIWSRVNELHKKHFSRELSIWAELALKAKKAIQQLHNGDNPVILNVPSDWILSDNAEFSNINLMLKKGNI